MGRTDHDLTPEGPPAGRGITEGELLLGYSGLAERRGQPAATAETVRHDLAAADEAEDPDGVSVRDDVAARDPA